MKVDRSRMFDLRVVQRNIRSGRVSKDEYGAYLAALPDSASKIKPRDEGGDEDGYDGEDYDDDDDDDDDLDDDLDDEDDDDEDDDDEVAASPATEPPIAHAAPSTAAPTVTPPVVSTPAEPAAPALHEPEPASSGQEPTG